MSSIFLIGKPTFKKIDGLSQIGAMVDWLHTREIDTVYWYDPGLSDPNLESGMSDWVGYVIDMHNRMMEPRIGIGADAQKITMAMIGRDWPDFINTDTNYLDSIPINWMQLKTPVIKQHTMNLDRPMVNMVMCLTQKQWDPRLSKGGGWTVIKPLIDWYASQGIPIIYMMSNGNFN